MDNTPTNKPTQFTLCLIQLKVIHDKPTNIERAREMIATAVKVHNPNLIVLPEFFQAPVSLKNLQNYIEDADDSPSLNFLKEQAIKHSIDLIGGSIPVYFNKDKTKIYNACFCFNKKGEVQSIYKKLHLFDIDIPGKIKSKESSKITKGDCFDVFKTEYATIGLGICYDIRFPELALTYKKEYNIDMMIYPAVFNTVTGPIYWDLLARSRAVDNQVYVALCSASRNYEDPSDYQAYGHSMLVQPDGVIQSTTGYEEGIVYGKVDLERKEEIGNNIPIWKQKRWDMYTVGSSGGKF